ncbi:MAG TPA: FHA domain-containing protein [Polyangiaceae bacterium]|nr:FHA domain-containing protein [Polyangiaceae bacterium]
MGGPLNLFVIDRSGAARSPFGPARPQLVIGRAYECDVRLGDPRASRAHAVLTRDASSGAVLLTDLGSKNGTSIGGRRLHPSMPVPLGEDVIVRIGDTLLVLEAQPPELEDEGGGPPLRSASSPEDGATAGGLALALETSRHEGEPAPARPLASALRPAASLEAAVERAASGPAGASVVGTPGPAPGRRPLCECPDEVAALAVAFVVRACEAMQRPDPPRLSPQALAVLEAYRWPGDLPELWVVIERAVALCAGPCIRLAHLPLERLCGSDARPPPRPEAPSETGLWPIIRPPKAGWVC